MMAIAGMTIMTFSAQEIWAGNPQSLCTNINLSFFYLYLVFFVSVIFGVNVIDYQKICEKKILLLSCTLVSMAIDLGLLYISEFFILLTISQLGTDLLKSSICIFLIVLPWSLGEITLSSLTVEYMRKRVKKLQAEISKLRKEAAELEKRRDDGEKKLKELEKKKEKFEKAFKRGSKK